ncbi:VOC family protein [Virgibacillus doumboii]|uniref:VOC family protein n=1 Tax=Virgibacillus doumboii TaxID=2697503 RepID=UPI0013E0790B|nr:VOC family protein [Virgibacillus doumboii]
MGIFKGVHQVNFRVKDMDLSRKWYHEVLGCTVQKDFGDTVVLGVDNTPGNNTSICLIKHAEGSVPDNENGTHPVLSISPEHAENCKNQLQEQGVEIVEGGGQAHFKFKDPDGNLIEAYLPGLYEEKQYEHLR